MKRELKWVKRLLSGLLAALLLVAGVPLIGLEVRAETSVGSSGDYRYEVNEDGETVTIWYQGDDEDVVIPSEIDGKRVTGIGWEAFYYNSSITNVVMPEGVTEIGMSSFFGCDNLQDVVIPESVTVIRTEAFGNCSSLKKLELPQGLTNIEKSVFNGCGGLESITVAAGNRSYDSREKCNAIIETESNTLLRGCKNTVIPDNVTSIGDSAFYGCSSLVEAVIPEGVTAIGDSAFYGCSSLTEVVIPETVTEIRRGVFYGCSSLVEVMIPRRATTIRGHAFYGCSRLSDLTIPEGITNIEDGAFYGCSSLESISVESGNKNYDSRGNCNAIIDTERNLLISGCRNTAIPETVKEIGDFAFAGCSSLENVKIPGSVSNIGDSAFAGCSSLENVKIPGSVSDIGDSAFAGCRSLRFVELPDSVTVIRSSVFSHCNSLTGVMIPDNVNTIEMAAFLGCSSLESVEIPKGVTSGIVPITFDGCSGLESIKVAAGNTAYDSREDCNAIIITGSNVLLRGCKNTIIPDSIMGISGEAFSRCSNLTSVKIPANVKDIGCGAFYGCNSLANVEISEGVESIEDAAFEDCSSLLSVTIPESVKNIGYRAFGYVSFNAVENFTIYGIKGTAAETYARENGFIFQPIGEGTDISQAEVKLEKDSYIFDGTAKTPSVTVSLGGRTLVPNVDYTVAYRDNVNAGVAKAVVTGKGKYTGSIEKAFTISKAEQPSVLIVCRKTTYNVAYGAKPFKIKASAEGIKLAYTSSNKKVAVVGRNTGKVTAKGCGIATVTVRAGEESIKVTVKVSPRKQTVKSAKTDGGRKLAVKWSKDKNVTGYQVQLSMNKNFKRIAKKHSVSKWSKNAYTFKKLQTGRKYYIRVRSYKKTGKEMLYGAWSKVKLSGRIIR